MSLNNSKAKEETAEEVGGGGGLGLGVGIGAGANPCGG